MVRSRLPAALLATVLGLLALPAAAQAAFPGRNGRIAVSFFSLQEPELGPDRSDSAIELRRPDQAPSAGARRVIGCVQVTGDAPSQSGNCSLEYRSPAFSPDGRWIAFAAGKRIALVRVDGGGLRLLPATGGAPGNPTWSPGGARVLFDSARRPDGSGTRDLWVTAASGAGAPRRVVRDASDPSWSPRALFAFVRAGRVWVSRSSGARAHAVSRAGASAPDFHPRGDRLVYATGRGPLAVVRADGRGRRALDASLQGALAPAWSPDGRRLAWATFDGTVYTGDAFAPSWQPLR